jgi:hypothetical protein
VNKTEAAGSPQKQNGNDSPNKKRKLDRNLITLEENVDKREKLNNEQGHRLEETEAKKAAKAPVPRIVIKDGEIVIDNGDDDIAGANNNNELQLVSEKKKITTSNSFKNINHSEKWTEEETQKFYRALEIFGTDFSLICKLFPTRNRNQIKNKFLKEERTSKDKIDTIFKKDAKSRNLKKIFRKATDMYSKVVEDERNPESSSKVRIRVLSATTQLTAPKLMAGVVVVVVQVRVVVASFSPIQEPSSREPARTGVIALPALEALMVWTRTSSMTSAVFLLQNSGKGKRRRRCT